MKTHAIKNIRSSFVAVTVLLVFYFAAPKVLASQPYPTNRIASVSTPVSVDQVQVVTTPDERAPQDNHPKVLGPIIFFGIMLIVFAYIIYKLCQMLDKVIPPPEKKPDPPPGSPTNSPPITINPVGPPGPALADAGTMLPDTNHTWGSMPTYDVTAFNFKNPIESGNFDTYWSTRVLLSTNLQQWEDSNYQVDCYICTPLGSVLYAYYHYGTNYYNCYFTGSFISTNRFAPCYFNLTDHPYRPVQFFRLNPL